MVRGFAITLLLGIVVGIFSSMFITKNILLMFIPEDKENI
jgi:preprotein translocase subunit SecD